MPIAQLPFPQGAVAAAQNPQGAPVAGIVPQPGPPPTPNPLQELGGVQQGAPQGVPEAGNVAGLQDFFQKIKDPKARLQAAMLLGQTVPAPDEALLQSQLQSQLQSGLQPQGGV